MAGKLPRRKIAEYVASEIIAGASSNVLMQQVAAYLVDTGRTREADLVIRAIEDALAFRGLVVARVMSATSLTDDMKVSIKTLVDAKDVRISETVDPTLIGGVIVSTPSQKLDASIKRRLLTLQEAKI